MEFTGLADDEVLRLWAAAMAELRRRGVIRTANNPIGDYAEYVAARHFGLEQADGSTAAFDGRDRDGTRYQIKARRMSGKTPSRVLSALRNLDQDGFDYLVVVLFEDDFRLRARFKTRRRGGRGRRGSRRG